VEVLAQVERQVQVVVLVLLEQEEHRELVVHLVLQEVQDLVEVLEQEEHLELVELVDLLELAVQVEFRINIKQHQRHILI
jgi:hypothetical protein